MATTYRSVPTRYGRARLADALQSGTPVGLHTMALGDGNGSLVSPNEDMKALVNEVFRAEINEIERIDDNTVRIALRVPSEIGGFTVREVGLFDDDGKMVAVGNYAGTYKPTPDDGAVRELYVRMWLKVSNVDQVTITVDTSIIYATKTWVEAQIRAHAESRDHPAATTTAKGFVELATQEEVDAGTDSQRSVVPRTLKAFIDKILAAYATVKQLTDHAASRDHPDATTTAKGFVELATPVEAKNRADATRALTPATGSVMLSEHEQAVTAHKASQIALATPLENFSGVETVQQLLAALGAVAKEAVHNGIAGRSEGDCHPISAITGLQKALSDLQQELDALGDGGFVEIDATDQRVGTGFKVNGQKLYFGSGEHNLFDNDGAGNAGLQFGMDREQSTMQGGAVELQANIDDTGNGSWELSLDSRNRAPGDTIEFDQVLRGSRNGLEWNGHSVFHSGQAAIIGSAQLKDGQVWAQHLGTGTPESNWAWGRVSAAAAISKGWTGFAQLPGGVFIMWGRVGGTGRVWTGFPRNFPTTARRVVCTDEGSARYIYGASGLEAGGFWVEGPGSTFGTHYIAIGD
ncbi:MAG: phage tail protein [Pseudomonadota bacterium]|nr:phage tail protein [Pseudomonadota bacterium]